MVHAGEGLEAAEDIGGVMVTISMISTLVSEWGSHIGGVGFDMDAIQGNVPEGIQRAGLALVEEVAG